MKGKLAILITVCAAVLAINLDTTIVNVALPTISDELDAGTRQLQWIVDGYNLAFAGLVLAAGSLSDRFGRRPALIVGLLGFAAASAVGAMVTDAGALVAARFGDGRLRGTDLPDHAVDHQQHLPRAPRARGGARRLGCGRRHRRRRRSGRRRSAARALRLGERLLGAGPARPGHGGRRLRPGAGVARPRRPAAGPARARHLGGDARDADLDDHRGARARLDLGGHAHRLRGERCWPWSPSWSASVVRRTRCWTSPCSATRGSARRAAR